MPRVGQMVLNPILPETDIRVLYKKEELKGVTENNLSRRAKLEMQLAVWSLAVPIHTTLYNALHSLYQSTTLILGRCRFCLCMGEHLLPWLF